MKGSRGHYLINMPPRQGGRVCVFVLRRKEVRVQGAKQAICLS